MDFQVHSNPEFHSYTWSFVVQILTTPELPLECCLIWETLGEEEI